MLNRFLWLPSCSVLLVTLFYAFSLVSGVPLEDEWRWFKELLIPFESGKVSFYTYLTGEYSFLSHSHFLALLFLWVDKHFLSLDFAYFAYIGLVFYGFGFLLLSSYVTASKNTSAFVLIPASLIMACGYCCLTTDFPWLLVVFEYVYFFISILLLVVFDLFLKGKVKFSLLLVLFVATLIFADTIGMTAVFVVLSLYTILCFIKEGSFKYLAALIFVLAVVLALELFLLGKGVPLGGHTRGQTIKALLSHPADIIISFFSIFTQPLLDMVVLQSVFGDKTFRIFQFAVGLIMFELVAFSLVLWFRQGGYKRSFLPVMLLMYAFISWALILMSRYLDFGVYVMDAQRYVRGFTLIYVALGLLFLGMTHNRLSKSILIISCICVVGSYLVTAVFQFHNKKYVAAYFSNAVIELKREPLDATELPKYIPRCAKNYCDTSIQYLKDNQLSVFSKP